VQTAGQPLRLMQVDDLLSIPGYTPDIVKALQEYVTVLPPQAERTPVNVNTAPPEVIAAVVPEISLPEAQALAAGRERAWFKDLGDFRNRANKPALANEGAIAVRTGFFYVFGLVRLDRASLQTLALLQRDPINHTVRIRWIREN
jgi:general secretion pathway protein K